MSVRDSHPADALPEIVIEGKRLEVAVLGGPAGADRPTIVMLHEGLGCVGLWKHFPTALALRTGARVVAYSRYGHGASDVLSEARDVRYMHREGEVVLPQLLAQLGIERPVLFGHSDGASIALIFAGTYPGRVAGLVLEAPHVFVEDVSLASIASAAVAYGETQLKDKLARYHRDPDRTFWGWNDIWLDPLFADWNIESYLRSVTCPTLVLQGANDEYGTVAQLRAIQEALPNAAIELLENCGHSPHRDRADATLQATAGFIEARALET